jgi:hypothetical protein
MLLLLWVFRFQCGRGGHSQPDLSMTKGVTVLIYLWFYAVNFSIIVFNFSFGLSLPVAFDPNYLIGPLGSLNLP